MKILLQLFFFGILCFNTYTFGQCQGGTSFGSVAAPTGTATTTISSCTFAGDYNTITGVTAGSSYLFTVSNTQCVTIHSGSSTGPVVAFGTGAVTFTAPSSGTYYAVISTNCTGCLSASTCLTTTITCTSCGTDPCTSPSVIPGCGQGFTLNTTGTSSFVSNLCATATPGLEQIYTYTAVTNGTYSFNVTSVTGGGYAIGWKAVTAGCSGTGWTCAGVATTPGSVGSMNLVAGTTYYFIMDATSTAASSIGFSLTCPTGGPTIAGDCNIATNVCSNASFSIDPNGFGAINEICPAGNCAANPSTNVNGTNSGCLLSEELNSTWMIVNVLTGGNLTFSLGTPNSGNFNCLDWSMWNYTPATCAAIQAGTQAPIRCNYNGDCEQFTGLASTLPTGASSMTNWEAPVTAGSYSQYLICLSNYSSAVTTVPLSFGGTAVVSCSPLGLEVITLNGEEYKGFNLLNWKSSLELNAQNYIIERSFDGINFEQIGIVASNGMSIEESSYSFKDLNPKNGYNYYRVTMTHNNSANITSEVIGINQRYQTELNMLECYPNPTKDKLTILVNAQTTETCVLQLTDLSGKVLYTTSENLTKGMNTLSFDLSQVENGFYLLNIINKDKTISSQRIIKE